MIVRRGWRALAGPAVLSAAALAGFAAPAGATPVASTPEQAAAYGRVFLEPSRSTNYVQFAPAVGDREFQQGMDLLARLYPRYMTSTTVAAALGEPLAVSTGPDGIPAGASGDTGDGRPFNVLELTDKTVPDAGKRYAAVMFAHSAEYCGREGVIRWVEDLLRATGDPSVTFTDGPGIGGEHRLTAAELLRRVKLFVVSSSPDGWAAGDLTGRFQQNTGGGVNSNRVAWQKGWVFATKTLADHRYKTATESEGLAVGRFFEQIRARELAGRPFAAAGDFHGPLPTALVLEHDGSNDPAKLLRIPDLGRRAKNALDAVFARYASQLGSSSYAALTAAAAAYRDGIRDLTPGLTDPFGGLAVPGTANGLNGIVNTVGDYPLAWATAAGIADGIGYTGSSTWGGFLSSQLGADTLTFELNCTQAAPYSPATVQLFVDNARAGLTTVAVQAAAADRDPPQRDLGGRVGFYEDGTRVTDRDGNPAPVPQGFPGRPLLSQLEQVPYDVSQTDYFRDLPEITVQRPRAVIPARLDRGLETLSTLVVADQQPKDTGGLKSWVAAGGNLVLTDSALRLLPALGVGRPDDVRRDYGYIGYSDLDRREPMTSGLSPLARQTYDPIGLGFPLLMQRDSYWQCNSGEPPDCGSGTQNSAPIWSLARSALAAVPGARVVGTADPPATRTTTREGTASDRATIAVIPIGKGRIVAFGALLPRPSEEYPHYFGLEGYTISPSGQELLLRAMTWPRAARSAPSRSTPPPRLVRRRLPGGRLRIAALHPPARTTSVRFLLGGRTVGRDRRAPFTVTVTLTPAQRRAGTLRVRAILRRSGARSRTLSRVLVRRTPRGRRAGTAAAPPSGRTGETPAVRSTQTDPAARAYVAAMLAHHDQGIALARAAFTATRRAAVRAVALRMISEQTQEVAYMRALQRAWGPARGGHEAMAMHRPAAMGLASARDVALLRRARGRRADRLFVALMTRHHRGAIRMSARALRDTGQLDVSFLARGVLVAQRLELAMLRELRSSEGRRAPWAGVAGL